MPLTIIQRCLISHMISLIKLYERLNELDKVDENDFIVAENRKEIFENIIFEEKQIKFFLGNDHYHLTGLLWKLKNLSLKFDPRINDHEKLILRIDVERESLRSIGHKKYIRGLSSKHCKSWARTHRNIRMMR